MIKLIQALVAVSLLLSGNTVVAQDASSSDVVPAQEVIEPSVSGDNGAVAPSLDELVKTHSAVKEQIIALLENDPELSPKRALIEGGFEFHEPKLRSLDEIMVLDSSDVAVGMVAGGIVGTIFKICDNNYTKVDDAIRFMATFEGANYLTSGLGMDFVTFGDKFNYSLAAVEVAMGAVLLGRWKTNRGEGGEGQSAAGPGTRFCSPLTALTSVGLGGMRVYDSAQYSDHAAAKTYVGVVDGAGAIVGGGLELASPVFDFGMEMLGKLMDKMGQD